MRGGLGKRWEMNVEERERGVQKVQFGIYVYVCCDFMRCIVCACLDFRLKADWQIVYLMLTDLEMFVDCARIARWTLFRHPHRMDTERKSISGRNDGKSICKQIFAELNFLQRIFFTKLYVRLGWC